MESCWIIAAKMTFTEVVPPENFWSAIKVWTDRPHVINVKILAAEIIKSWPDIPFDTTQLKNLLMSGKYCEQTIDDVLRNSNNQLNIIDDKVCKKYKKTSANTLILRNLLPKQVHVHSDVLEAAFLDEIETSAVYFPQMNGVPSSITPDFPYKFRLIDNEIHLLLNCEKSCTPSKSLQWLKEKVLPKIYKWCLNVPKQPCIPSLSLVNVKDYNFNLCYLKKKYAKKFVDIWPEYHNTDPKKYVYEDISIAAYLITLWEAERKKLSLSRKQTFVDLGCGNGLLDHILSSEGHDGIGVDLRRRKIWDAYGPETKLYEMTVEPNDKQLYPGYDWIIGNHADELTPWIPVIAARSSYHMRVFLLPCCFFTFNGKYARSHHNVTQYQSYLNFIQSVCSQIGFQVHVDKLRIPSTKRACFVCTSRTYPVNDELSMDLKRKDFIMSCIKSESTDSKNWVPNFIPRNAVEKTQNCTQLEKTTVHDTVIFIVKKLLATEEICCMERDSEKIFWNRGGKIVLKDLCSMLDSQVLELMKKQRGGIQTFLKNHHDIFEVKNKYLHLRIPLPSNCNENQPRQIKNIRSKSHYKCKTCFFHFHHPQGCPLKETQCRYSHKD